MASSVASGYSRYPTGNRTGTDFQVAPADRLETTMGKGSTPRPRQVSREELDLRWEYMGGKMSREKFEQRLAEIRERFSHTNRTQ